MQYDFESSAEAYAPPGEGSLRYLIIPSEYYTLPVDARENFSRVGELLVCGINGRWEQLRPEIEITARQDVERLFASGLKAGKYNGSGVYAYDVYSATDEKGLIWFFNVKPEEGWSPATQTTVFLPAERWDQERQFAILQALDEVQTP